MNLQDMHSIAEGYRKRSGMAILGRKRESIITDRVVPKHLMGRINAKAQRSTEATKEEDFFCGSPE
jgi:hypothetical protein